MRVAVIGAAGYVGGELLRIVFQHPGIRECVATSRSQAGKPIAGTHPGLALLTEARFSGAGAAEAARGADVVFLALEHGQSSQVMGEIIDAGPGLVVDLSADFRIQDGRLHERHYGPHPAPALVHRFRYALADVLGAGLRGATALAAPGARLMAHSGPFVRGIYATLHARLAEPAEPGTLAARYAAAFAGRPFVRLLDAPPELTHVVGTNLALIHVAPSADGREVQVCVAVDNLVKGAGGQAVQAMNLALGLDQAAGLRLP